MTPAPIIARPEQATPEWLTDVLVAGGAAPSTARVADLDMVPIGTGQLGANVRYTLGWAGVDPTDVPATVVGKFASADENSRRTGPEHGTYVREVGFYRELAPRCAMRVPDCHVAELDPVTGEFVLLLEDVTPAEPGDQITGCSLDQAALAMEELGRLHASFWGDTSLSSYDWLAPRRDGAAVLSGLYHAVVGQFVEQYGDRLSERARRVAERFDTHVPDWLATDGQPLTLIHSDYRPDNLLFGTGAEAPPLTVVDWQTVALGAGPNDAAYFLGGSLDTEIRQEHEHDLVDVYRRSLAAGGVDVDRDDLWASYRVNAVAGMFTTVAASVVVERTDRGDDMFCAMAERHAAHAEDLEAFELLDTHA